MKIVLFALLFSVCGALGYGYKYKLNQKSNLLNFLYEFCKFYDSNMTLFKNNIVEIIDKFKREENFKNFHQFFVSESGIYRFDKAFLQKFLSEGSELMIIDNYFSGLGKNDYEYEKEKNKNFEAYIKSALEKARKVAEQKGGLCFKLSLALGAVLCIVLW